MYKKITRHIQFYSIYVFIKKKKESISIAPIAKIKRRNVPLKKKKLEKCWQTYILLLEKHKKK